ncbi:MAG: S8 family serine peptidase, partial [Ignavibacteria bacterium]
TGVDTAHVDLRPHLVSPSLWYNAVDESHDPSDGFNHGTAMSGIAAALGNNIAGICGAAWNCSIMPVKVFSDEAFTTDLILGKGLIWAWENGADVLNNSWGGGTYTPFITMAVQNAKQFGRNGKGTVVFAATGNQDSAGVYYPSVLPEVIAVGGISPCFERKSVTSCDQEQWGADYGEGLSVVSPTPKIGCTTIDGSWHFYCNGTSSSCPQITAIGALILSKNINLSADSVRLIIERTARKVGNYSYNVQKPNGTWNNEMGYGLPDAKACLDMTPQGPQVVYDQVPPVIKITPPQSGILNKPLVINAAITDNQLVAGGNYPPRLYYNISNSPVTGIVNGVHGSNNNYSFTFPSGTPLLNYGMSMRYYIAAQDTSSNGNITTYPVGGRGVNPPGRFAPPKKLYLQNTNFRDTTLHSLEVPIHFVAETETTIVSHINVPFDKTVLGVRSLINLTHDYMGDLSLSLISPSGTEIVLAAGIGNDGQGFINTNFDDYSQNSIQDTNFRYPYTGSFAPVDKLWFINGENSSGQWTLKIVDNYAPEQGTLNSWSITLRYSTDRDISDIPDHFDLMENYPNPFNPVTRIPFNVPYYSRVKIIIYDITGREVAKLLDEPRSPRFNDFVDFDISSVKINGGSGIASGVYFYALYSDEKFVKSRRMVILK